MQLALSAMPDGIETWVVKKLYPQVKTHIDEHGQVECWSLL